MKSNLEPEECLECGKFFKSVKSHVRVHNMTVTQYKEKYNNPPMNNPMSDPEVKKRQKETIQKKYGVDNIAKSKEVREKTKRTNLERYGVEYISQVKETRSKVKQTNLQRYGFVSNLNMPEIKEKSRSLEARKKEYKTKKENGTLATSKREKAFYKLLCELFDASDIEYGAFIHKWEIDFYVKSIDTYIQFDGRYWHGLTSDINEIKKLQDGRSKSIYNAYVKDRAQDVWFKENKMKLVRITDEELLILSKDEIRDKIVNE